MELIIRAIKFIIVSLLSIVYWPLNAAFLWLQKHYRSWYKTDIISFIIATPIYYLFFIIVFILSVPLEMFGDQMHPPDMRFR